MKLTFVASAMLISLSVQASELVSTCAIGTKTSKRVAILRDAPIGGTSIYYVRQDGTRRPFFGSPDNSRGSDVRIRCAGHRRHALVVTGEFTSNFLQGFVLVSNRTNGKIERLDFAEKSAPGWLYLGTSETLVVFPEQGYGETDRKYVVYRHLAGAKADLEAIGTDKLPPTAGFEVVKLAFTQD
jgi:hypothetical protein